MCEGFIPKGPETNGGGVHASGPVRQPDYASDVVGGAGRPVSQPERLGDVVKQVVARAAKIAFQDPVTMRHGCGKQSQ